MKASDEFHICNAYCALGLGWSGNPGQRIGPHRGVRPISYDESLDEPPFCAACGHELVSWPGEFGASGEMHAYTDLDLFEEMDS